MLIFLFYFFTTKEENSLFQHKKIIIGTIERYNGIRLRSGGNWNYKYYVNGKEYNDIHLSPQNAKPNYYTDLLNGKSFPVIYDSTHPSNSIMLIFPSDFQALNIPFPDSLEWVKSILP